MRFALVRRVATMALVLQEAKRRRTSVRKLMSLANPAVQLRFADQVGRLARSRRRDDYVDIYWLVLANSTAVENAWELLSNPEKAPHARKRHQATNLRYAQAIAAYELARYRDAVSYFLAIQERDPDELKLNHDYLKAAYSAGKILDRDLALRFFARQFV
ncbi:MAG: hypothetical protein MI824_23840, partial [Hyphomicrobiales bacterium]|nr:hypothetical protein [Hyphomicrobiales bacterium]